MNSGVNPGAHADLDRYLNQLVQQRHLSPHTHAAYRRDLSSLVAFCDQQQLSDWPALSAHAVRAFAASCHRQGLGGKSIQRRLSAVRGLFEYLLREGRVGSNPAQDIRAPKSERKLPTVLDVDQMERLLDADVFEASAHDALAVRDRALMELLYSSGLRLAELTGLDLPALDLAGGLVTVTGKGRKTRVVPVGRKAQAALQTWLAIRADLLPPGSAELAVFLSRNGLRLSPRRRATAPGCVGAPAGPGRSRPSAPSAPLVRQSSAGIQRRPARRAGTARPRRHQHHPDIYPLEFSTSCGCLR